MFKRKYTGLSLIAVAVVAAAIGCMVGQTARQDGQSASAAAQGEGGAKASPTKALPDRDVYYPGSEELAPGEMRVVALGTGQPTIRPKQAAACWLVELGNGDKFLFDIGQGSASRLSAMKIPMDYLNKVFIGHLHMDHFGDLDELWIGGVKMNRTYPLRIWGPSGSKPELGTKYALEHMKKMYTWDATTLIGRLDQRSYQLEVHEFDFKGVNQVIYEENGVTIRSIPAIHVFDGAVSFILEWNGLKFCYSSDTFPNKWWTEHARGADISVHECFAPPQVLLEKQKYPPDFALRLSALLHTSPAQFGRIMAMTKPRLAVGYHFYNDHDTLPVVQEAVRKTYDGPLALATDYMVFNVTKSDVRVRMAAVDQDIWPMKATRPKLVDRSKAIDGMSGFTKSGGEWMPDLLESIWSEFNERNGTNVPLTLPSAK